MFIYACNWLWNLPFSLVLWNLAGFWGINMDRLRGEQVKRWKDEEEFCI